MGVTALHRIHWIGIALLVGLTLGMVFDTSDAPLYGVDTQGYGLLLPEQRRFEDALLREYNGSRLFSDLVVYPHWVNPAGQRKRVYLVSGRYWDGEPIERDGHRVAEWVPRCVITPTPFRPLEAGRLGLSAEYPSVLEYLEALHGRAGVVYRYAWWAAYAMPLWLAGSVLLIGGVWPTAINLIAFGRLTRPPEAQTLSVWSSLWRARSRGVAGKRASHASGFPAPFPAPPLEEATASDDAAPEEEGPAPAARAPERPVPVLVTQPLEAMPEEPAESKEFGADRDDFYPTELHPPHQPHRRDHPRGFSLVELLVVIGIIALLVAILLPALRNARESAKCAQCASQLRQIGNAMQMYTNENHGWLPLWSSGWKTWPPGQSGDTPGPAWTIELMPYIGPPDSPIYSCPSFPQPVRTYFLEAVWAYKNGHEGTKLSDIALSSQFVVSGDITQALAYPYPYGKNATCDADFSDEYGPMLMFPEHGGFLMHRGGNNVLFADTHVETFGAFDPARITFHPTRLRSWQEVHSGGPG